ncbi:MAG: neutral/alkaline non-lysosomal ceramidase N-terminal domain-containing protein, partial [Planctomycetia bacterium]
MQTLLRLLPTAVLAALLPLGSLVPTRADEQPPVVDPTLKPAAALAGDLDPLWKCLTGSRVRCAVSGTVTVTRGTAPVAVTLRFERYDAASYDLSLSHADYAVVLRRRADATALALPRHRIVHVGRGGTDPVDHLDPAGLGPRLVSDATRAVVAKPLLAQPSAAMLAGLACSVLGVRHDPEDARWERGDGWLDFDDAGRRITAVAEGVRVDLTVGEPADRAGCDDFPGYDLRPVPRDELERTICRGIRRGLEILLPGPALASPDQESRSVEHGRLEWREGLRVVTLHGSPEEIGRAHGQLLATEARRCIDSVLHVVGLADTIRQGTWFRTRLDDAARRLMPHIPERHRRETRALADALGLDPAVVAAANVFPELFHCSGFTVSGSATTDGTLYHGRVLDYMTVIGLQDAAAAFVIAPEGSIPFVSVGYAGFTGSVSGMNIRGISLGEMGGGGEGKWDGVPMATLMRRALEECGTLDDVVDLWTRSPRTCEYYYVFADGKTRTSVGVAATPDRIELVKPGAGHERLGPGIPECIVLSAGDRLECLRRRVQESLGRIDEAGAIRLMARPVAAESNLHNVLFVPERLLLHVAHASHTKPAAECPSVRLDLAALVQAIPSARAAVAPPSGVDDAPREPALVPGARFHAADTLAVGDEPKDDARQCLDGLRWEPRPFDVAIEAAVVGQGDLRVRFPSPCDGGAECNRDVWMEWYRARDAAGDVTAGPACVVVHESGSDMVVGRLVARGLSAYGIHAFMVQLPFYGARRPPGGRPGGEVVLPAVRQAVADVRRARDAVAVLPLVDAARIGLEGTSLGGFITATAAGLDRGYDKVFIVLAGGDLAGVLENGKRDAEKVRRKLAEAGVGEAEVRASLHAIEPTRLAHRYRADRTWIYSAKYDDVVPPAHARLLAEAAGLPADHLLQMEANHYSGIIYLPMLLARIAGEIHGTRPARPAAAAPVEPAAEPAAQRTGPAPATTDTEADTEASQQAASAGDAPTAAAAPAPGWKAGVARIAITPSDSLWMSGYAARDRPADGKLTDLWAKALAIEDPTGRRHVLVTLDLVGIDRVTGRSLAAAVAARFGLAREAVVFSTSHTHSGPVVRDNLRAMYPLDDAAWALVRRYGEQLEESVVRVVGDALADLRPADLAWTVGRAHFAVNRRNNPEKDVPALRAADRLAGPVDHDVPVLVVREPGASGPESVRGIAVGYACHATVLSGYQWSGDWPGYAQIELEKRFPNATALTWVGCGADSNPLPRRTVELAQRYGAELAAAVSAAIDRRLVPLGGTLAAAYEEIPLEFSPPPSRADLERTAASTNRFEAARARMLLESWDRDGRLPTSYPYPIQTWRLGDGPHWVFLGGEVVVDFAVRLKSELGCGRTWVAAYSNDVMAYVASRRVLAEGGYEG